jgi:hypothetical protein
MTCTFLYQTKLQLTVEFAKLIIILLSGSTSKYISVLGALRAAPRAIKLKIRTIYSRASRPHSPEAVSIQLELNLFCMLSISPLLVLAASAIFVTAAPI